MKKVNRRVEDWSTHGSPMALQSSPYLISNELTARVLLPELDHVMWLSRSAELGIVVLDRAGFVVGVNLAARELLATEDGLSQAGRGVEACLPLENETPAAAIRLAIDEPDDDRPGAAPVSMFRISRKKSSSLLVAVLRNGKRRYDGDFGAILIISDPERPLHESVHMLCELYHLTPGETRLTEHLIDGFTLAEIGEIMMLKTSTVRVYLKQIFTKTGVNRQAMLIRLFLTSRIPFNFPETYPIVTRTARVSTTLPDRLNS